MTEKKLKLAEQALKQEQAKRRKAELAQEYQEAKSRLMAKLAKCVGKNNALPMPAAFETAYPDRDWGHRINDTRAVRDLITDLQWGDPEKGIPPVPICSSTSNNRPGYYIPVGQELEEWLQKLEKEHLKGLKLVSLHRRMSLPELLGQKELILRAAAEGCGDGR